MNPVIATKYQPVSCKAHVNYIFSDGIQVKSRTHYLYIAKRYRDNETLCIITSRKVGNAVKRNRCRRQVRAFFDLFKSHISRDYDIIVVVHSYMVGCKSKDIYTVLEKQLKQQGIWDK